MYTSFTKGITIITQVNNLKEEKLTWKTVYVVSTYNDLVVLLS